MNDNTLKKVHDQATIYSLLSGAKELNAEAFIWRLVGSDKHLGQVRIESIRKTRNDFCVIPAEGQDRIVQDLMGNHSQIDLYIPESALLLRCTVKTKDAPFRYYLQIPAFVAQVERRKSLRLNVHSQSDVRVSFGKSVTLPRPMSQHFLKDCFDISSGGFSFFVSKMESKFFQIGDNIPLVEVKAGKWSAKMAAQIVTIREIEPDEFNGFSYKVWRVSCKFSQIDVISKKYLERYIFERIKNELHVINE